MRKSMNFIDFSEIVSSHFQFDVLFFFFFNMALLSDFLSNFHINVNVSNVSIKFTENVCQVFFLIDAFFFVI
jgi:hypothetical protein